ncbi:hypothetical protein [Reinekea sp. G2M2-21]|uniref:hypothetical protein n=1 Tax=Reinekea sp. G2M2-21 TaxID=2788942 RepID=UPI0018AB8C81|nr:hypothetical protein [Reinekea sp. G2M2-21]
MKTNRSIIKSPMDLHTELQLGFDALKDAINCVSDAVQFQESDPISGYLTRVEIPHESATDDKTGLVARSFIPVTDIIAPELKGEFLKAVCNMQKIKDGANRYVVRWPGIIRTTPAVIDALTRLEQSREGLLEILKGIKNGRPKRQLLEQYASHLNLNYLRRKIVILNQPLEKIAFQWEGLGYVHSKLDGKGLAQFLSDNSVSDDVYEKLMKQCSQVGHLYHRFYQAPSVFAQYKVVGQTLWQRKRISLPIITSEPVPECLTRLVAFDNSRYGGITSKNEDDESARIRKVRKDMGRYELVDKGYHLYLRKNEQLESSL